MKRQITLNLFYNPPTCRSAETRVITPNPRAARALGVPHLSIQHLAQQIVYRMQHSIASAFSAHRLLKTAVARVGGVQDIEGFARAVEPVIHEIFRAGIDLNELLKWGSPRAKRLAGIAWHYIDFLQERQSLDSSQMIQFAAKHVERRVPLHVVGYPRLSEDELVFLDALAEDGSVIFLPFAEHPLFSENEQAAQFFFEQGWLIEKPQNSTATYGERIAEAFLKKSAPAVDVQAHVYPSLECEVRGVLSRVKMLLDRGVLPSQIVLAVRDERAYGPLLLDVGEEYGIPIRALYEIPLQETRLGTWIELALEAVENHLPFEATLRLLAHPLSQYFPDLEFENKWRTLRQRHPSGLEDWQIQQIDLSLLDWPEKATRSEYIHQLDHLFQQFRLRQRCAYWPREIIAYYEMQQGLIDLDSSPNELLKMEIFMQEVREILRLLAVPLQPGRGGVELHTPAALQGARYDYVFVLGVAEGILPAPIQDNWVLDFYEREKLAKKGLRLEGSSERAKREMLAFCNLLPVTQKSLVFSYPQLMQNRETLPSSYFEIMQLLPVKPQEAAIASPIELRILSLRCHPDPNDTICLRAMHAWQVENARETAAAYDEYDGALGVLVDIKSYHFSPSQLRELGQCPFKWFSGHALHLSELEELEKELTPANRGSFYHRVLERLSQDASDKPDPRAYMQKELARIFLEVEEEMEMGRLHAWRQRRREMLDTVHRAILEPLFWDESTELLSCEHPFECEWYGLRVKGVIDRIDRRADGLVLLDYKTSSSKPAGVKNEDGQAKVDIQLPLYIHAVRTSLYPDEHIADAIYYSITKRKSLAKAEFNGEVMQDFAERVKRHFEIGNFPVDPDSGGEACKYCDYDCLCRRGNRLSRKERSSA